MCEKLYPVREEKKKACVKKLDKLEGEDLENARKEVETKI